MARNSLLCADVPLRNYSLHSVLKLTKLHCVWSWLPRRDRNCTSQECMQKHCKENIRHGYGLTDRRCPK